MTPSSTCWVADRRGEPPSAPHGRLPVRRRKLFPIRPIGSISGSAPGRHRAGLEVMGVLEAYGLPRSSASNLGLLRSRRPIPAVFGGDVVYLCRWDALSRGRETSCHRLRHGRRGGRGQHGDGACVRRDYERPWSAFRHRDRARTGRSALLPHLDHEHHPESTTAKVERMAAEVPRADLRHRRSDGHQGQRR